MRRGNKEASMSSFLLCYLLTGAALFCPSTGGDTLTPHQPLADDDEATLISAGGSFELGFFSPVDDVGSNNRYIGIWYHNISVKTVVWVANRQRPVIGRSGLLSVKADGTLVITQDNSSTVIWSSGSSAAPANPVARLLDNGNFVVGEADSSAFVDQNGYAWQSFDFPTDTLIPGMQLGWNLTSGLNRNLTSWTTATDPAPGYYTDGVDLHGDPQAFIWSAGTRQYWRGGPWNGLRFSGIPEMNSYGVIHFEFVMDSDRVGFNFYLLDPSATARLVMNHSGTLQTYVWMEERNQWNLIWFAPKDVCDSVSPCGPYGVCQPNVSPTCRCLQGFHRKNPMNWDLGDGSDGCARNTALDCRNGTDGFVKQSSVKLPDTSRATANRSVVSLDECRMLCLSNCSCTAYASANISTGSESGCILWTTELTDLTVYASGQGQDLYVRLAAADLDLESDHSHRSTVMIVLLPALAIFVLIACAACCVWLRRTKKRKPNNIDEETEARDLDLPLFDLDAIVDATGNFSIDNKLGEGGFGPVYKGRFGEAQMIAIKRLSETSTQGLGEFKNEIILIAKLQHRNLVRLLGCCIQGGERILVYEYMPNGSLDAFLFDRDKSASLDWRTRHNIIIGIAKGLLYLHHDSRFRIIHRDLKASNILLDKDMNPKISDFGMARIFGGDQTQANTRRVVGTYGYMSPEYVMDGIFSVKSDVFSFGVLVLEIISGMKNRGVYQSAHNLNLLGYVWRLWKEDKCLELVDRSTCHSFPMTEVIKCIKIGLLCVQERPEDRPTISSVVVMLGSDSTQLPEPKQPGFFVIRDPADTDSSTSKQRSVSLNHVSVTVLEGR